MFERFTERARQVVVLAQDESRELGDAFIGTEHLVLGLLREDEGIGARAIRSFGVTPEGLRDALRPDRGPVAPVASGQIPFTPRAKESLERALREAGALGDRFIGTEHLLLGLLRVGDESTLNALRQVGAEPGLLRHRVLELAQGVSVMTAARFAVEPLEGAPASWPAQLDRLAAGRRLVTVVQHDGSSYAVLDARP